MCVSLQHSPRTSSGLLNNLINRKLQRCFGHINWAIHNLADCFGLTCAIQSLHRLKLGCGAGYKLALCPIDVPGGRESLRRNGIFLHGVPPSQIGLAAADVKLIAGHVADRSKTHVLMTRSCVCLHRLQLHAVDNSPIQAFVIAELQSQRIQKGVLSAS